MLLPRCRKEPRETNNETFIQDFLLLVHSRLILHLKVINRNMNSTIHKINCNEIHKKPITQLTQVLLDKCPWKKPRDTNHTIDTSIVGQFTKSANWKLHKLLAWIWQSSGKNRSSLLQMNSSLWKQLDPPVRPTSAAWRILASSGNSHY